MAGDPGVSELVKTVHHLFDLADLARELEAKERPATGDAEQGPNSAPPERPRPGDAPNSDEGDVALASSPNRETAGR
jgi:hypothetical protein